MKLKQQIIEDAKDFNNEVTSDALISAFTSILSGDNTYTGKEIYEAQHHIKEVIKNEVVLSLDNQMNTFKHFLKTM